MSLISILADVYNNTLKINDSDIIILFDDSNNLWFSYNDVLQSLGYNHLKIQRQRLNLDKKYFNTFKNIYSSSAQNQLDKNTVSHRHKMISEEGLYILLNQSNKPIAKQLSAKLSSEVLPNLRKTGKYIIKGKEKQEIKKLNEKLRLKSHKIRLYQKELKRTVKQSHTNNTGNGFIYIIKVKTVHNGVEKICHKIGYTSNLEKRLATYKTGNPDVELVHSENLHCNKKQLESCVINLNILKLLKNKTEVICDVQLKKILEELEDCKALLEKHKST